MAYICQLFVLYMKVKQSALFLLLCSIAAVFATNTSVARNRDYELLHIRTDTVPKHVKIPHARKMADSAQVQNELDAIVAYLQGKKFLLASVDSVHWQNGRCVAYIHTGQKFVAGSIAIPENAADAVRYAGISPRKRLGMPQYTKKKEKILSYYENTGYPFARLSLDSIQIGPGAIGARLSVDPGMRYRIARIDYEGGIKVPDSYLHRQINISPGDIYCQKYIDRIPERIDDLSFAQLRGEPRVTFRPNGEALLSVPLESVRANTFDGIVGFAPNGPENEKLVVTGDVTLELHNTLKQGEDIRLHWEKLDEFSQNADASVYKKYILKSRIGAGAGVDIEKIDTTYLNTELSAESDYYMKGNSSIGLSYQNVQNRLVTDIAYDTIAETLNVLESKTHYWGVRYKYSVADNKRNPSKGFVTEIKVRNGQKKYSKTESVPDSVFSLYGQKNDVYEITASTALFIPLKKPFVLMLGNASGWQYADRLFENNLYRIGGAKSLRGFNEQSIYASSYAIGTAELRLLFDRLSNIYIFYDQAVYQNKSVNEDIRDFPKGFGLGLHVASKNSVFRISYAVGQQWHNPVIFSAGKIHFGYINRF